MAEEIKRGRTDGFDGVKGDATRKRLNLMLNKNKVKGDWRKQKVVTIYCTIVLQEWIYDGKEHLNYLSLGDEKFWHKSVV